ncbi:hypothetical protein LCGC14_2237920, partial [marine sediment metagenome]
MRILYRGYHFILKCIVIFIGIPNPNLYQGIAGFKQWLLLLKPVRPIFVVTDNTLKNLKVIEPILAHLDEQQIPWQLFSDVNANPTVNNVEDGLLLYRQYQCECIIAIGGGSVLDCAKLIAARTVQPNKSVAQLKGLFKVINKLPTLCAIPTTAGTGSETTVAAVVNDPNAQQKYAATDFTLVPSDAVLIPEFTQSVPAHITATTGIDALTHAIEAYVGINGLAFSNKRSLMAIELILKNLLIAYKNGDDLAARENMLLASFYAGQAFTRASVGYVHAIAHQFGAMYGTPHGLANSIVLPYVLEFSRDSISTRLASLAVILEFGDATESDSALTQKFIDKVHDLKEQLGIPNQLESLAQQDIPLIADAALKEARFQY